MSELFDLIDGDIQRYCDEHTSDEEQVLYELYRETNLKVLRPRMLSCKGQGTFLKIISKLVRPRYALELGTYTGYSTICLAEGLREDGLIYTIEQDPELQDIIESYLDKAQISQKTRLFIGDALDIIPTLTQTWDLIFVDADKVNYGRYYEMLVSKLSPHGIMLVDNVLWSGKVVEEVRHNDKDTQAIIAFNRLVQQDERVLNMILPFRDGMMLIEKR